MIDRPEQFRRARSCTRAKIEGAGYHERVSDLFCPWPIPSEQPLLAAGEVHVWFLPLDLAAEQVETLRDDLSTDETERASRFHFDRHRRQFVACRGQVRRLLAGYLNADPA